MSSDARVSFQISLPILTSSFMKYLFKPFAYWVVFYESSKRKSLRLPGLSMWCTVHWMALFCLHLVDIFKVWLIGLLLHAAFLTSHVTPVCFHRTSAVPLTVLSHNSKSPISVYPYTGRYWVSIFLFWICPRLNIVPTRFEPSNPLKYEFGYIEEEIVTYWENSRGRVRVGSAYRESHLSILSLNKHLLCPYHIPGILDARMQR